MALIKKRHAVWRRQTFFAASLYTLIITLSGALLGLVCDLPGLQLQILIFCGVSSALVAFAVLRQIVGQFSAPFLQGVISTVMFYYLGLGQPLMFFVLCLHIFLPSIFWHWVEMIRDVNR